MTTKKDPNEPPVLVELRRKLRERRIELNLPQKEVAARIGIAQGQLSDMEHGRFRPRVITLLRWAFAVEMELDFDLRKL